MHSKPSKKTNTQEKRVTIGIVGGGQLGRMLTVAAKKLGFSVVVIDPTPQSPAGQVADRQLVASFKDEQAILDLAKEVDVLTFEIELANDKALFTLQQQGKAIHPSPTTLSIIRDKLLQKEFLNNHQLPTAAFLPVTTADDIKQAAARFGYPFLLKARTDAYDGRGNFVVRKPADIPKGMALLANRALYVEQFVPFQKELAVMVARSISGAIAAYPVVETIHKDNICDVVMAPAAVSPKLQRLATETAKQVIQQLKGAGVFGVEMFLTNDNTIVINEIAPRVHNSGHYTIEATVTSQFEQHIRAITGLPLGETTMLTKAAVMKNILGEKTGSGFPDGLEKALQVPGASLHLYGKKESRPQRKMGHITVVGNSIADTLKRAEKARKAITL